MLHTDVVRLQNLVEGAEQVAQREGTDVARRLLSGELNFGTLVGRTTYPCFVFRGEKLLYWSDHTTRPEPENVGQPFREKLVEMKFGYYLAFRQTAGPYVVLTYIPLEKRYGISNRYLREGSEKALFRGLNVRIMPNMPGSRLPWLRSQEGKYLCSVESLQSNPITGKYLLLAFLGLGTGLYIVGWLVLARRLLGQGRILAGTASIVVPLAAYRAVLLYLGLPFSIVELPLFDPRLYAASWLSPSLGDLLINALLLTLTAYYLLLLFRRYGMVRQLRHIQNFWGRVVSGAVIVMAFWGYWSYCSGFTPIVSITPNWYWISPRIFRFRILSCCWAWPSCCTRVAIWLGFISCPSFSLPLAGPLPAGWALLYWRFPLYCSCLRV
ncbi:hypothetical protein [Hymenobacter cellulosilyticus]|uniref:Uncharacterized protein n=1 Tax=Hymenobacter cellulosilyticus TaxID=2932248 RepID=A0A8T9Q3B2_9BACT|nr:hypothetical protein [Hymenobacter cellulosilyticus]UOQ72034.1 hypothetical protein MUN79_26210 [Hymenobacter cellulosilyticus]